MTIDRDKESVVRRQPLSREQIDAQTRRERDEPRRRGRLPGRLIPLLVFAFIALMIARHEIPAVDDWWQQTFAPGQWQMKQACRQAAVEMSGNGAFTRVIEAGEVHETEQGFYVDGLVTGEMGEDGAEQRMAYTCYLDRSGRLVRLNRLDGRAQAPLP